MTQRGDLYTIDTGVLSVDVGLGTDLFKAIRVNGIEWFGANASFGITDAEGGAYLADIDAITILESGPVRSLVECAGKHVGDAGTLFDMRVLIEAWAGKPFIRLEYQFINREKVASVDVAEIALKFAASGAGDVLLERGITALTSQRGQMRVFWMLRRLFFSLLNTYLIRFTGISGQTGAMLKRAFVLRLFKRTRIFPRGLQLGKMALIWIFIPRVRIPSRFCRA